MIRIAIGLSTAAVLALALAVPLDAQAKPAKRGLRFTPQTQQDHQRLMDTRAISGTPALGVYCLGGADTNVHHLGFFARNRRIRVEFVSTGDPVASIIRFRTGSRAANNRYQGAVASDDDRGGNLEPLLNVRMAWDGSATLLVSGFGSGFFCYQFDVVPS